MEDLLRVARDSPTRSIAVVSHSSYLKTLLATAKNESLLNVATIQIRNGSVSIIDIRQDGARVSLGPKSALLGGLFSKADKSFHLSFPKPNVLRINEKRHLGSLA